jgi:hypothetical protein
VNGQFHVSQRCRQGAAVVRERSQRRTLGGKGVRPRVQRVLATEKVRFGKEPTRRAEKRSSIAAGLRGQVRVVRAQGRRRRHR